MEIVRVLTTLSEQVRLNLLVKSSNFRNIIYFENITF